MGELGDSLGLTVPEQGDGVTKWHRAHGAVEGKTVEELTKAAFAAVSIQHDYDLEELALTAQELNQSPIRELTRRDVAKVFGHDLSGERPLVPMLKGWFPLGGVDFSAIFGGVDTTSLSAQIERHMVRNDDWSVEYLFDQIGAYHCSRARFAALIGAAVHPLARRGPEQIALAKQLSEVLRREGYELVVVGEEASHPIYQVEPVAQGVQGKAKNLIFASNGPKPEIAMKDAINNDIAVMTNEASCLIYERPLTSKGLLWSELVDWWASRPGTDRAEAAKGLGERLKQSLDSDAEKNLFGTYFKAFRNELGDALPALIPQVYLHYDPAISKNLRHRLPLPRQRMDFLLLLPLRQRIVIEVDGKHHFAEGEKASLKVYAEMAAADRELRLAGYEIYRFGANELVGSGAVERIEAFFRQLFEKHSIGSARPVR